MRTLLLLFSLVGWGSGTLTESHFLSKELQRAVRQDEVVFVIEGVRRRMIGIPSPDPLVLVNFPDLDNQFKVHLLEDSGTIKLTLVHSDGKQYGSLQIMSIERTWQINIKLVTDLLLFVLGFLKV